MLQVVLCTENPIEIPGLECMTYELEDLGVDNVAQVLTSIAPQVCSSEQSLRLHSSRITLQCHYATNGHMECWHNQFCHSVALVQCS